MLKVKNKQGKIYVYKTQKRLGTIVDIDLYNNFKLVATLNNKKIKDIISELIKDYVNKHKRELYAQKIFQDF